uniref:Uncharacterized protein n=1 Tax=Panagrolaimus superbus TaxID=310955 RepID=A0A914YNS6_9BILA
MMPNTRNAFPDPIMKYMVQNVKSSKVFKAVTCRSRRLHNRNPVAVVKCLHNNYEGVWWTCKGACQSYGSSQESVRLDIGNGVRLWVTEKLDLVRPFIDIRRIYQSDASYVSLMNQKMCINDLKVLGNNA